MFKIYFKLIFNQPQISKAIENNNESNSKFCLKTRTETNKYINFAF